jgi:hypothetical protein
VHVRLIDSSLLTRFGWFGLAVAVLAPLDASYTIQSSTTQMHNAANVV